MQLRDHIESPCGLRFMFEQLELQAGYTRRWLLDQPMMRTGEEIAQTYAVLHRFVEFIAQTDIPYINTLQFRLQGLKDIRTTIKNLSQNAVLDDIELFEVKHLAILAVDVAERLRNHGLDDAVAIPDLNEVITILDPDGLKMATFYVYDSYCQELRDLRSQMRQHPEQQEELLVEAAEIEEGVRRDLSKQLHPFAKALEAAQVALAKIDLNLAKALQMRQWGLCFPNISNDDETRYNLELCKRQQKNQPQQQQQQGNDKDKQQDKQKQDQQQQQQDKQKQQQQQKQEPKMSKENAEQLLNAAMQQEKQTQERMKKAQQQPQRRNIQKNW